MDYPLKGFSRPNDQDVSAVKTKFMRRYKILESRLPGLRTIKLEIKIPTFLSGKFAH